MDCNVFVFFWSYLISCITSHRDPIADCACSYCDFTFINLRYLVLVISENKHSFFVLSLPFMIRGSGGISMINIETIFILVLPLIPASLFFKLNGQIFPSLFTQMSCLFMCLLVFGLPLLKFNNSKKTLQAYMEEKVVYMMVQ